MEKQNRFNKRFKRGSYSSVLSLIVIVLVIVGNLLIGELPDRYTELDVSGSSLYEISEQTKEVVKGLKEDVTIYLIAQKGSENGILKEFLNRYEELSGHIKVKQVDPVENPSFTTKYSGSTVYENSLIVESKKRYKVVGYYDIYQSSYAGSDSNGEAVYTTEFAGEGQLTSAIGYVVTDTLPTLYTLNGHGEMTLPDSLKSSINQENIAVESLNLITKGSIPENCDGIFIISPQRDLTENEKTMLTEYMNGGGKMFLISDYVAEEMPNLTSLLASYGLETKKGVVLEGDSNHYIQQNYYMVPDYISHTITEPMQTNDIRCLAITAQALQETEGNKDATISWLLQTSEKAFNKEEIVDSGSLVQTDEDEVGSFYLGAVSKKGSGENESAVVALTTSSFVDESVNNYIAGGNYDLVINAIGWLCEHEEAITIHTKNLDTEYIALNASHVIIWSVVLVVVIPLLLLVTGVVIWIVRRRH